MDTTTEAAEQVEQVEAAEQVEQVEAAEQGGAAAARREAAKYRTRLRDAERERDALAERVAAYQRRDAERAAEGILAQPADLFDIGRAVLADLLGEDGDVDAEKVREAALSLVESRPGLRAEREFPDLAQGRGQPGREPITWAAALKKR